MFEKVNPCHPDKIADRIAGAIVDLAYTLEENPRVAVEVLLGHGSCHIITESSANIPPEKAREAAKRIAGDVYTSYILVPQDGHLSANQANGVRCGDNGIFKGVPVTAEQTQLAKFARALFERFPTDGKFILNGEHLTVCQSNAAKGDLDRAIIDLYHNLKYTANPLGEWAGGIDVDAGATNRKLGSDMGDSVTGGGLHGKDLSKADVSVNIYAWLKAQATGKTVELCCAIGDEIVDGRPYYQIVEIAREYIKNLGGFEKFAEWGLIR